MIKLEDKSHFKVLIYEEKDWPNFQCLSRGTCVDVRCFPIQWLFNSDRKDEFLSFIVHYAPLSKENFNNFYFYGDLDDCIDKFHPRIMKPVEPIEMENFNKEDWFNYMKNTLFPIEIAPNKSGKIILYH